MWAAGVILFVLLAGQYPFQATTAGELRAQLQAGTPVTPLPSTCSPAARRLVAALMHPTVAVRATAAAALAFDPWLTGLSHGGTNTGGSGGDSGGDSGGLSGLGGDEDQLVPSGL
jgi:serine/threonine protein kinase